MSEITADQYRVNALLDIVADNARRDAEALMNERLKHAVALQQAQAELQQARASAQPTPSEPAPVEGPASVGESDESETSSEV